MDYSALGLFIPFVVFGVFGLLAILSSIFWIWLVVDCAKNEPSGSNEQLIWLLVIIFVHFVGALIYYTARRPERMRLLGH